MTHFISKEYSDSSWYIAEKLFLILSPVDTQKKMHIYGKTLGDQNPLQP